MDNDGIHFVDGIYIACHREERSDVATFLLRIATTSVRTGLAMTERDSVELQI